MGCGSDMISALLCIFIPFPPGIQMLLDTFCSIAPALNAPKSSMDQNLNQKKQTKIKRHKKQKNPLESNGSSGFLKNYNNLDIFGWKDLTF